jgi:hypothetical protein
MGNSEEGATMSKKVLLLIASVLVSSIGAAAQ